MAPSLLKKAENMTLLDGKALLLINRKNKEGMRSTSKFIIWGAILTDFFFFCILYQVKTDIMHIISRGYSNKRAMRP